MIKYRPADERGHADYGWLSTYHTFSFNTYRDPNHMGFHSLRVINDDTVQPGRGFGTHPHENMEIVSYVLEGSLEHKDSMGNGSVVEAGEVQRITAGTGIWHSERNPSDRLSAHFLQIWIHPAESGLKPEYEQRSFDRSEKLGRWRLIVSPDRREDSLKINRDAFIWATVIRRAMVVEKPLDPRRSYWLHVATGDVQFGEQTLRAGDGVALERETELSLVGKDEAEILLFDLESTEKGS